MYIYIHTHSHVCVFMWFLETSTRHEGNTKVLHADCVSYDICTCMM